MTREEAAVDIKSKLITLSRDELIAFLAGMDGRDIGELLEEAVDIINDIFLGEEEDAETMDVKATHSDIMEIIETSREVEE